MFTGWSRDHPGRRKDCKSENVWKKIIKMSGIPSKLNGKSAKSVTMSSWVTNLLLRPKLIKIPQMSCVAVSWQVFLELAAMNTTVCWLFN